MATRWQQHIQGSFQQPSDRFAGGEIPYSVRSHRGYKRGDTTQKGNRARNSQGEVNHRGGLISIQVMGDVLSSVVGIFGSESCKIGSCLRYVQPWGLSVAGICWAKFHGYAKQAGSKWLKICLLGLCLKQQCVKKGIWCQQAFELLGLSPL